MFTLQSVEGATALCLRKKGAGLNFKILYS